MMGITIDQFRGDAVALEALARAWAFKPFRWSIAPESSELHALVVHRLDDMVRRPGVHRWGVCRNAALSALGVLQPLEWDSRVLGVPAGRIELIAVGGYQQRHEALDVLVHAGIARAREAGLQHISVRVDAEDDAAIHVLEQRGFLNVDALTTFGAAASAIAPSGTPADGVELRPVQTKDVAAVAELAAVSFTDGRFHSDPSIPRQVAAAVYRAWATNCCERRAADETIVLTDRGRVAGFVAARIQPDTVTHLKHPTGTIVLIATSPEARGRGFGGTLVSAAGEWFRRHGAAALDVGTQLRNIRAGRLYEKCGYRLVAAALSFRTVLTR